LKVKSKVMSRNDIRKAGVEALAQTLGPIGMVCFYSRLAKQKAEHLRQHGTIR